MFDIQHPAINAIMNGRVRVTGTLQKMLTSIARLVGASGHEADSNFHAVLLCAVPGSL